MKKHFLTLPIGTKLQLMVWLLFVVVFVTMASMLFFSQRSQLIAASDKLLHAHVEDLVKLLELQNKEKSAQVGVILRVATALFDSAKLQITDSMITMSAVHQITKDVVDVRVPVWKLSGKALHGGNFKLVDESVALAGGTVTIFQKIPQGYLRISTTVRNKEGARAVGTYIGNDSPVTQAIERGETYYGRAFVVDDWYQTIYKPIVFDGKIQGILYAGIREKDLGFLKEILRTRQYFSSGYPFLMDKKGDFIIHPSREGLNAAAEPHIRQMLEHKQGSLLYEQDGEAHKIYYQYFDPFEMYVAINVPESDLYAAQVNQARMIMLISFLIAVGLSFAGARFISSQISKPIATLTQNIADLAKGKVIKLKNLMRGDEIGRITSALAQLADGLSDYANFARSIGQGNFKANFQPLSEEDQLGLSLLDMRDKLEAADLENQRRNWTNDGLAQLASLLREEANPERLADRALAKLIKLLDAQHGAFFIAEKDAEGRVALNMKASYAYMRKKYLKSSFAPGEGLIGQVFLEKEKVMLKNTPADFIQIITGLGEAKPGYTLLLPLLVREEALGVIEIAGLKPLEDYQIAFAEQATSAIGATIASLQINERTTLLLQESQLKAQQLAAQEEELRQNFEELEATQEEMRRNEKRAAETIRKLQAELDALKAGRPTETVV